MSCRRPRLRRFRIALFALATFSALAAGAPSVSTTTPFRTAPFSTMTTTGLTHARQMIPGPHLFCLFPYDVPIIMRRAFARLRPQVLILVEGEIWPALLNAARRAGCPIALVNGRMSDRS